MQIRMIILVSALMSPVLAHSKQVLPDMVSCNLAYVQMKNAEKYEMRKMHIDRTGENTVRVSFIDYQQNEVKALGELHLVQVNSRSEIYENKGLRLTVYLNPNFSDAREAVVEGVDRSGHRILIRTKNCAG